MHEAELFGFLGSSNSRAAGGLPEIEVVAANLKRAGFECHEEGHAFLGQYIGLTVEHPPTLLIAGERIASWTRFEPSAVCTVRDARISRRCATVAGVALMPVGVDSFHLTIYSGSDGRFYAGFDSSVYRYGNSRNDMFSMMKNGVRPSFLGDWAAQ
ncbi:MULTISPECIES: SUKH-3 domain-containing protein [Micromonospora]|uniref:SUKH-3 domain-containing protein n=1 Tax=Micromonospora TaxID=1873 RepID=UPI0009FC7EB0|nr:hypothetical protein [Micromonospora sp. CMU55-4]